MRKYLSTLEDETTQRSIEEYLGAFTESFKLILQQNPVERMGYAVLLASKTALRLKAANPKLREHEIAGRLQVIARNVRLTTILNDLTPEEKRILQLHPMNPLGIKKSKSATSPVRQSVRRLGHKKSKKTKKAGTRKRV
ncbi:hypothetical protein K8S19_07590 [bacterium]|nr:hypothetical protein [bacterium]